MNATESGLDRDASEGDLDESFMANLCERARPRSAVMRLLRSAGLRAVQSQFVPWRAWRRARPGTASAATGWVPASSGWLESRPAFL